MDIEDVANRTETKPTIATLDKRNECLPSDLVPEKMQPPLREFIYNLFESFTHHDDILEWPIQKFRRHCDKAVLSFRKIYHIQPAHAQIGYVYRQLRLLDSDPQSALLLPNPIITEWFEEWCLKKRSRCNSGVTVFSLMTSPHPRYQDPKTGKWKTQKYSCRHNCYYCPNEPAHKDNNWQPQARSYLYQEPTVQRANRQKFSPSQQIWERGQVYLMNGHPIDKMEVIILGGTWSEYPRDYQEWFLGQIYWAANHLITWCRLKSQGCDIIPPENSISDSKSIQYQEPGDRRHANLPEYRGLEQEQLANADPRNVCRVVGLTIETRPDAITPDILADCRRWGVTRIQIGVQHTNQKILDGVNRGCTLKDTIDSTRLMQDYGFKTVYHWMPDLPGSSPTLDREMWQRVLNPQISKSSSNTPIQHWDLLADEWKIYPFSALPWSICESWVKDGTYKSYGTDTLVEVLAYCKRLIARNGLGRIRIVRLIRDIPVPYIIAGNRVAHLRQVIEKYLQSHGERCVCVRCREIREGTPVLKYAHWNMTVRRTLASSTIQHKTTPQPKTIKIKDSLGYFLTIFISSIWYYLDLFLNFFYPGQPGRWYWGNPVTSNPMSELILKLPVYRETIPETLDEMTKSTSSYAYECFLSLEGGKDFPDAPLYGFLRLRLSPNAGGEKFPSLRGLALVRELHVYGRSRGIVKWEQTGSDSNKTKKVQYSKYTQHFGVGTALLKMAEYHSWKQGFQGIAIIAGVGVRPYYQKRGYTLVDTYMVKRW